MLTAAIILGDHEQASWLDLVVKANRVTGKPEQLDELKKRLDVVMMPLPDAAPPAVPVPSLGGLQAAEAVSVS
jgi:hypothetical protein